MADTVTSPSGKTLHYVATMSTTPQSDAEVKEVRIKDDFYNFTRDKVKNDLEARRNAPWLISQSQTSLCGMAVVAYFYAKKAYEDYKQFVLDLHANGTATSAAGYTLTTDDDKHLEQYKPGDGKYPNGMSPADFILLASLRDEENGIFDYDPDEKNAGGVSEGSAGFSLPSEVSKLMKELVGLEVQNNANVAFSAATDATVVAYLQALQTKLANGSCVALLIHTNMLLNDKPFFTTPNHWLGLEKIAFDEKSKVVDLSYYSWGALLQRFISFDVFIDCCFGYVEGK